MTGFEIQGSEDPISTLSRMVVQTTFDDLPADVIEHAKHTLLDAMAVTIGGSGMEGIPALVDLVKGQGREARVDPAVLWRPGPGSRGGTRDRADASGDGLRRPA